MSASPLWFGPADRPLAGWLELPAEGKARAGVVLCPSLLGECTNAYRSFRELSARLARHHLAVLRFDYPGTGDSAGLVDEPGQVSSWITGAGAGVDLLRRRGLDHITVVGLRMGAIIAAAAAADVEADALVLWDPSTSGRAWLRQQRVVMRLGLAHLQGADEDVLGVRLPEATERELSAFSIADVPTRDIPTLVVVRAGTARPAPVSERWPAAQWWDSVEQQQLLDVDSLAARPATRTVAAIAAWVDGVAPPAANHRVADGPSDRTTATMVNRHGRTVTEELVSLGSAGLAGVLTSPDGAAADGVTVVFLNTAAERHTGPERAWVDVSRELAGRGLRSLRFDLAGMGDSPTPEGRHEDMPFEPRALDDVVEVVRTVVDDPEKVVLVGLCSGAYHAIEAGLVLGARGVVALNPVPERLVVRDLPRQAPHVRTSPTWVRRLGRTRVLHRVQLYFPHALWSLLHGLRLVSNPAGPLRRLEKGGTTTLMLSGELELRPYLLRGGRDMRRLATRPGFELITVDQLDHSMLRRRPRERALAVLVDHLLKYAPVEPGNRADHHAG